MYRRTFMVLVSTAAGCPLAGYAQQKALPVIGFVGAFPLGVKTQIEPEQAAFREAKALGVAIPQSILARADEVIE